jgi:UDP-N-acetylglucosamine--N-acetylmuramyl-(pentapeptide) pyrophosphoryl-undecaprenol N-acetylglucosamine transferase
MLQSLPGLTEKMPQLQYIHLAGPADVQTVKAAYQTHACKAVVYPYLTEMELALGAATLAVSRAGASSICELAAMRLPAVLIPYPHAMDNHQYWNARALADRGAAQLLPEKEAAPETLTAMIVRLLQDTAARTAMQHALAKQHSPMAAELIADKMLALLPDPVAGQIRPKRSTPFQRSLQAAPRWNQSEKA